MTLLLHAHPLSSYCQKVLIALYETGAPFEFRFLDLGDAAERAAFLELWPVGKMPVLEDRGRGVALPESSIIIEYLSRHHPGPATLVPDDPERALEVRLRDRFFDLHVHDPMQKIVGDRLRPAGAKDAHGVEKARASLRTAYGMLDALAAGRRWAAGDFFSMADCAAAPALCYAGKVEPFDAHASLKAYFARLAERPSYARALKEAEPYMGLFPQ